MAKLTVIIPTGNELHNIEGVIKCVNFADEIIVVDSFSNDGTYEIAKKLATKVFLALVTRDSCPSVCTFKPISSCLQKFCKSRIL